MLALPTSLKQSVTHILRHAREIAFIIDSFLKKRYGRKSALPSLYALLEENKTSLPLFFSAELQFLYFFLDKEDTTINPK